MSALGSLVVKLALEYGQYTTGLDKSEQASLKFAKNAQAAMDRAEKSVGNLATKVVGVVAAYASADAVLARINSSINDLAALDDLAQKTGSAVESLSKIQQVAKAFNQDFAVVDEGITKLAKGMAGLDDESNKTIVGLKALGISTKDSLGNLRDPADVMVELAQKLQNYNDGANKTALANDVIKKTGADLLPFLNDLAGSYDNFTGASAESAAEAAAFQDKLNGLKQEASQYFEKLTIQLLPSMNDLTGAFIDNLNASRDLNGDRSAITWADDLAMSAANIYDFFHNIILLAEGVSASFSAVFADIKMVAGAANELNPVNMAKSFASGQNPMVNIALLSAERDKTLAESNAVWDRISSAKSLSDSFAERIKNRANGIEASPYQSPQSDKKDLKYTSGQAAADAAKAKEISDYQKLTRSINDKIAANQAEINIGEPLTESEKLLANVISQRADGAIKLTDSEYQHVQVLVQKLAAGEQDLALTKQRTEAEDNYQKILDETFQLQSDAYDAMESTTRALEEKATAQEYENSLIGLSIEQIAELNAARYAEQIGVLETEKAYLESQAGREADIEQIDRQIEAMKRLRDAEISEPFLKRAADQHKEFWDSVESNAHETWRQVGVNGTNAFKNIGKTIKTAILDVLYQLTIKKWILSIGASFSATQAMTVAAGEAGSISGSGSFVGNGSGSMFGTLSDSIQALNTNVVGSIEKLGAFLSTGEGGLGDTIGGFMGQYSSEIAAGLAFAPAALSLLKGDVKTAAFQGAGAGIGLALGGPIGGAIGAVLGGALGGLFGSKKKTPRYSAGVSSTYENGAFASVDLSRIAGFNKDAGGREGMTSAAEIFSKSLGSLLDAFNIDSVIKTNLEFFRRKGAWGWGSATVDGVQADGTGRIYNKDQQKAYDEFLNAFLTTGLINAIKVSKLPEGLKSLFDDITNRAQMGNMVEAVINLGAAQDKLTTLYSLTASQAGQVSTATGLVGDELIAFVNKLANTAQATRAVGEVLIGYKDSLVTASGLSSLPASVKDFDDLLKGIDKTTQAGVDSFAKLFQLRGNFAQFTASIDALKAGVNSAIFNSLTPAQQQLKRQEDLAKIFNKLNIAVPTSVQELIAIGESIDYTTSAGLDLAAAFPSLVSAFNETKNGVASLVDSLGELSADKFKSYVDYSRAQSYVQNGIPLSLLPSYDVGTAYVPQDGPAMIHQGERILTADENRQFTASAWASNDAIVSLLNNLIAELRAGNVPQTIALQKIERYLNRIDAVGVILSETDNAGNRTVIDTRVVA